MSIDKQTLLPPMAPGNLVGARKASTKCQGLRDCAAITLRPEKESDVWWSREWYLGILTVIEYFVQVHLEGRVDVDLKATILEKTKTLRKLIEDAPKDALISDERRALFKSTWMDLADHIAWWEGRVFHEKTMFKKWKELAYSE
ncbi:MAG: hypothetical protein ACLQVJ_07960 [Syntrophobacteraceae bacterium]